MRSVVIALVALLGVLAGGSRPVMAGCTSKLLGYTPLVEIGGIWVAPVKLNGQLASLELDTGASQAALTTAAVQRLQLPVVNQISDLESGFGGFRATRVTRLDGFDLAGFKPSGLIFAIIDIPQPTYDVAPVSGLLGLSVLSVFETEIDFAGERLSFYDDPTCADPTPPWKGQYGTIAMRMRSSNLRELIDNNDVINSATAGHLGPRRGRANVADLFVPVTVGGHVFQALLDTGARMTIRPEAAAAAGLPATGTPATAHGIDGHPVEGYRTTVPRLQLGDETFDTVPIFVAPGLLKDADMIVGRDLLRGHRVFLSFKTSRMFLQRGNPG